MSNEYHLADGSPRYGSRSADQTQTLPREPLSSRAEDVPEAAARLGLNDMAAAIDRRLAGAWADAPDPLVETLRNDYPEELAAAQDLVTLHLGSQRQWRLKAQAVRDRQLAGTAGRRRASGSAGQILALRLGLMAALIALPTYVLATDRENLLKLVLVGVACIVAALIGGHHITTHARVPVVPGIRSAWLAELRQDVINATLVAVLQSKGTVLEARTVAAARRGWESIQTASKAVSALQA